MYPEEIDTNRYCSDDHCNVPTADELNVLRKPVTRDFQLPIILTLAVLCVLLCIGLILCFILLRRKSSKSSLVNIKLSVLRAIARLEVDRLGSSCSCIIIVRANNCSTLIALLLFYLRSHGIYLFTCSHRAMYCLA